MNIHNKKQMLTILTIVFVIILGMLLRHVHEIADYSISVFGSVLRHVLYYGLGIAWDILFIRALYKKILKYF